MVDKMWYEWQYRHPKNFWSYHGGSASTFTNSSKYAQFPNGAPPFLNVSLTYKVQGEIY